MSQIWRAARSSPKQVKFFGTKRQRAALKAKRRHAPAKKHNAAPRRATKLRRAHLAAKRRILGADYARITKQQRRKKINRAHRRSTAKKRSNPGEIISFLTGNPAKRRKKTVARHGKRRAARRHTNAGRPRHRKPVMHHRRRHHNPGGIGKPMAWVEGGLGVLGGVVITRALPQVLLGANNVSYMGYAANAAAAAAAGFLSNMLMPRRPVVTAAVVAGGFAALIARIIGDQTSFGSYLALTGVGDYMMSNWTTPQRLINPNQAQFEVGSPLNFGGPSMSISSMGDDYGRRGGAC